MTAAQLETALAEARGAVLAAPDPSAALARLERWIAREQQFQGSPAAIPTDELAQARAAGIPAHLAATVRRCPNERTES